jgi:hypothetical protein
MASTSPSQTLPRLPDLVKLQNGNVIVKELEDSDLESQVSPDDKPTEGELWNSSQINMWRTCATLVSFLVMGASDAGYGVSCKSKSLECCIPRLSVET